MTSLPVAAVLPELLTALKTAPQVLLSAPTGAGKSTWLPLQLLQQGPVAGKILLLEPRRLAARNVAQRLAEALNEKAWRNGRLPDARAKLRGGRVPGWK
ncbi:ATP-dependent helicase HrpB [Salmonella enterica subsp. enterica]|nr:ATP-dependent helicase HrpB [Salmonella enterica subsp. enterica]